MPRLRMIAGPNGSGKTVLTNGLRENYHLNFGYYVNADKIEDILRKKQMISFRRFGLKADIVRFREYYETHALRQSADVDWEIRRNTFYLNKKLPTRTYFPTLFADYIRNELMQAKETFSFETVMSDVNKIQLLAKAADCGYRTYLYYICTEDETINIDRVADRVKKHGHNVPREKIISRYTRSLENLLRAIKLTNRAFLFDNSGEGYRLVAEIKDGKEINFDPSFVPNWFEKYVLNKLT